MLLIRPAFMGACVCLVVYRQVTSTVIVWRRWWTSRRECQTTWRSAAVDVNISSPSVAWPQSLRPSRCVCTRRRPWFQHTPRHSRPVIRSAPPLCRTQCSCTKVSWSLRPAVFWALKRCDLIKYYAVGFTNTLLIDQSIDQSINKSIRLIFGIMEL